MNAPHPEVGAGRPPSHGDPNALVSVVCAPIEFRNPAGFAERA